MDSDSIIYLASNEGKKKAYRLLMSFETIDDKNYFIYTNDVKDEDGFIKAYAGIYSYVDDKEVLLPVNSDYELEIVSRMLNKLEQEEGI